MNFDDLFGLLLFVVFIALPALSRMAGSKNKPGGGAPGQGAPGQGGPGQGAPGQGVPGQGRTATASTARPGSAPAGGPATTSASGGDELERRLAEARERVRRAIEGPGSAPSTPASNQTQIPARPRPAASRTNPVRRTGAFVSTDRDDGLLSTPFDPKAVGMLGRERSAARDRSKRFAEAPALQIERPGARSGSRKVSGSAFSTDPETIRAAIIWHQVLGEPRARRPLGGRPSTLRSR